ncbi:MAG: hypothetical protein ACHQ1D_06910 [Nitrososphaerales archaeon]
MKWSILIPALFFLTETRSQDPLIELTFKDKSNFDITTVFGNKRPRRFYVLSSTDNWNSYRFYLTEQQMRESHEHSPYAHTYIFKDTMLNRIIKTSEKDSLYRRTQIIKPRRLTNVSKEFSYINSFTQAKNGFFFSVTEPIYTSDRLFAFIDLAIYKKGKEKVDLNDSYFGSVFLVYENVKEKGWVRIKKIDHVLL